MRMQRECLGSAQLSSGGWLRKLVCREVCEAPGPGCSRASQLGAQQAASDQTQADGTCSSALLPCRRHASFCCRAPRRRRHCGGVKRPGLCPGPGPLQQAGRVYRGRCAPRIGGPASQVVHSCGSAQQAARRQLPLLRALSCNPHAAARPTPPIMSAVGAYLRGAGFNWSTNPLGLPVPQAANTIVAFHPGRASAKSAQEQRLAARWQQKSGASAWQPLGGPTRALRL